MRSRGTTGWNPRVGLTISLVISIVALVVSLSDITNDTTETAYIDVAKVYNEFDMKNELEANLLRVTNERDAILDSMKISMQAVDNKYSLKKKINDKDMLEWQHLKYKYQTMEQEFLESNSSMRQRYSEQIWKQLNQYISDYGENHKYGYIYGANGNGTLMYAKEKNDITGEVIEYVNKRYKGVD